MKRLLPVALLATLSAAAVYGGEFFPLANGNTWTYRDAASGQTFTVRVGTPVAMQSGRVYHYLNGYAQRQLLVRVDESNQLVFLDEDTERELLLTSFREDGQWWNAPHRECAQQGQTQTKRGTHNGAGGNWQSVLEIRFQSSACADAGLLQEQFAENIGMVRRVVQTIAGPRTFDLSYARTGTQVVEGGDRGRFMLSAVANPRLRVWQVMLRVDMGYAPGVRVRFPSTQDFDAALRDSNGNVVFTWSASRSFAQMERVVTVGTGYTATLEVPFPAGTSNPQSVYSLEAWLATGAEEPKFAAVTSVVVPQVMIP